MLNHGLKINLQWMIYNRFNILARNFASSVLDNCGCTIKPHTTNRNPRNLERLTIARKPSGYHLDKKGREFWHKLEIIKKNKYILGQVVHNSGKVVVSASSNEIPLGKRLYRANDVAAYINVARILAQRCFESGINQMCCFVDESSSGDKVKQFIEVMQKEGVILSESRQYQPITPWSREVMVKPWKV